MPKTVPTIPTAPPERRTIPHGVPDVAPSDPKPDRGPIPGGPCQPFSKDTLKALHQKTSL
jgi:hypothetical protein